MASLNRLKPGQIIWDYHSYIQGNTCIRVQGEWPVKIIEVDLEKRKALVSWNGNSPRWMRESHLKKFRVSRKKKK